MNPSSTAALWTGRLLSTVVALFLFADAAVSLFLPRWLDAELAATAFPPGMVRPLGLVMLACGLLYAVPRTSVLGAIATTGFLGGAICTHARLGEIGSPPQLLCLAIGILAWAGLWLRDGRLRELLPLRR